MSNRLRSIGLFVVAVSSFWACEPDLDTLDSAYSPGNGGTGGATSGTGGTGGTEAGGSGGNPTGGVGGSGVGGTGDTGGDAGQAGASGDSSQLGGTGGTGGGTPSASCDNDAVDPDETDLNCGGPSDCPRCGTNLDCLQNSDCLSQVCKGHVCAAPTCGDGVKNQDETGKDCGGKCAPDIACAIGTACKVDEDCMSEVCKGHICAEHCHNDRKEADETDTDCGGATCDPCAAMKGCEDGGDCISKICNNKQCTQASCDDNVRNQDESDKDCGGICAARDSGDVEEADLKYCQVPQTCKLSTDCDTVVCTMGKCAADVTLTTELIDDFEDGDMVVAPINGRVGNWYPYGDGTGTNLTGSAAPIPDWRGLNSSFGMHGTGTEFNTWGSGVGADLNTGNQGKQPYDASAYSGVTFWARAAALTSVSVLFPDAETDPAGNICTTCGLHWAKAIQVGTDWKRYTVMFDSLTLEPGTSPDPGPFQPNTLVSVQFRVTPSTTYDLWLDDVAFVVPDGL